MKHNYLQAILSSFLVACVLAISVSAMASDKGSCSAIRLDRNGGPFEKLPVYDQNRYAKNDTNLCYAVMGSLLIDAHRYQKNQPVPPLTAPLSIALNYKFNQADLPIGLRDPVSSSDPSSLADSLVGSGFIDTAINANLDRRVCDQQFLQSFDDAIGSEQHKNVLIGSDQDSTTENFLKNILDQTEQYRRDTQMIDSVTARAESLNSFFRCRTDQGVSNIHDVLQAVKLANRAASPIKKATAFLKKICEGQSFDVRVPKAQKLEGLPGDFLVENAALVAKLRESTMTAEQRQKLVRDFQERFDFKKKIKKLEAQIHSLLSSQTPTPIGIGYCHESLKTTGEVSCAPGHASVIIGRRFIPETGVCELLVRDSYGPNCNDAEGKPKYAWPCENGSVWIASDKLLRSASSISWIPNH